MLQIAVTSAPNDLAICTADVPTPPDAAFDQHPVPCPHFPLIANGSQSGERRVPDGRRLFEREVRRLGQEVVLSSARILGEGAFTPAEHLVAGSKLRHVPAGCLDLPGHIDPRYLPLRLEHLGHHTHGVRHAPQKVPVADIDPGRATAYQHPVVRDHRPIDLSKLQGVS